MLVTYGINVIIAKFAKRCCPGVSSGVGVSGGVGVIGGIGVSDDIGKYK